MIKNSIKKQTDDAIRSFGHVRIVMRENHITINSYPFLSTGCFSSKPIKFQYTTRQWNSGGYKWIIGEQLKNE